MNKLLYDPLFFCEIIINFMNYFWVFLWSYEGYVEIICVWKKQFLINFIYRFYLFDEVNMNDLI